jgi:superfamily II DNA or RNA helicase
MSARYRWGLSDDHHRADGRTFLVTDLMGQVADKIGDRDLLAQGAIAGVEIFLDPLDFEAGWYANRPLDEKGDPIPPSGEEFTRLLAEMVADDRRTSQIAARVAAEVEKGETFLVFSHRVEHVNRILRMFEAAGVPAGPMLGGTPEFERTRAGLLSGLVKVGVGTMKALGKGVNVPDVTSGYAATPVVTSSQVFRQAKGRIIRPKKDGGVAKMWVSWDRRVFGDAPVRKLVKWHRGHVRIAVGSELLTPAEYAGTRKRKGKERTNGSQKDEDDEGVARE